MPSVTTITDLEAQFSEAREATKRFFEECSAAMEAQGYTSYDLPADLAPKAKDLSARFHTPLVRLSTLVRQSPMFGDADLSTMLLAVRRIDAALRLRQYEEWGPQVLHDEDIVLDVKPAGFSEDRQLQPMEALVEIDDVLDQVSRRLSVLRAQAEAEAAGEVAPARTVPGAASIEVQPGSAFIMMMIDPEKPELEDVKRAIQEECARFGIRATRADDIEHSGEITQKVLDEIRTSEFLIADLTGERPSVYYEVGFAHAIGKRPILYRRAGTRLHFDLAIHNCPEYKNVTELRERLRKRLTAITGGE
ncbi:hypothetical protein [Halomonas sp. LBP4]|uniref:hypothetical protein n=1 Tax=Halomonas sp. LBP4 TaxID=2044917 RepID=UPI000D7729EC|nr:hypothetical protein [Halomonas sp. LBP4]PXX94650.1 hypothetical protein CR157_21730 [Halomonas sp. LBP4]